MDIFVSVIGWIGTVLLLGAYGLLTARRVSAGGLLYQGMNLVGSVALMINSAYYSAWPSAALNLVWLAIGVAGLVHARRAQAAVAPQANPRE